MFYIEIILSATGVLIAFYLFLYNIIKRYKFAINKLFSFISFISCILFVVIFLQMINFRTSYVLLLTRIYTALILFLTVLLFHLFQIYPKKRSKALLIIITGIPGYIFSVISGITDLVILNIITGNTFEIKLGEYNIVYFMLIFAYFAGIIIILIYKSTTIKNILLRNDLIYILYGITISILFLFTLAVYLPMYWDNYAYINIGITIFEIVILLIMNYAVSDIISIDIKKYYINSLIWLLIFLLLLIPVMLLLKYNASLGEKIPPTGLAIILFIYLFIFFQYFKPKIESFFQKGYRELADKLNNFLRSTAQLSISEQNKFNEDFFLLLIEGLVKNFNIDGATLFLYNNTKNKFISSYNIGKTMKDTEIDFNNGIIQCININPIILYKPILYTDDSYSENKGKALDFFNKNSVEITIPFFNHEKNLIGLLFLGRLLSKKVYSKTFLSILELYQLQFQQQLSNELILEKAKATQVIEHDKMVVDSIKKRIIPKELTQIKGIRISSFFINNSMYGGDYYDSIRISNNKIGIFITDSSYSGIDSAIILLELYTILHTTVRHFDSPDKILNSMNWVISTSRFSKKYAPAFCIIYSSPGEILYSNAASNPLIVFNPQDSQFTSYTTEGIPIGVSKIYKYSTKSLKLIPESIGMLYSDGLIAAINQEGESYSLDRIKKIIMENKENSPALLARAIYQDFNDFIKEKKQVNDVSLIIFKI